ncbi:helix-turn-helix domain-containing protein [Caulobacter segnis]
MDRIEAMRVFVAALDEGSLAGAARRPSRSPAAVSRAIAFLERTRRGSNCCIARPAPCGSARPASAYAPALPPHPDDRPGGSRTSPPWASARRRAGHLTISAPPISGEDILRPGCRRLSAGPSPPSRSISLLGPADEPGRGGHRRRLARGSAGCPDSR